MKIVVGLAERHLEQFVKMIFANLRRPTGLTIVFDFRGFEIFEDKGAQSSTKSKLMILSFVKFLN